MNIPVWIWGFLYLVGMGMFNVWFEDYKGLQSVFWPIAAPYRIGVSLLRTIKEMLAESKKRRREKPTKIKKPDAELLCHHCKQSMKDGAFR